MLVGSLDLLASVNRKSEIVLQSGLSLFPVPVPVLSGEEAQLQTEPHFQIECPPNPDNNQQSTIVQVTFEGQSLIGPASYNLAYRIEPTSYFPTSTARCRHLQSLEPREHLLCTSVPRHPFLSATGAFAHFSSQSTMQSASERSEVVTPMQDRPSTPPPPPYSPLTPVFAQLEPVAASGATIVPPPLSPTPTTHDPFDQQYGDQAPLPPAKPAEFKPRPPPVPISESENPDAIALRSAISILQMQKQQSLRDLKTLDRLKDTVAANPEEFARELAAGHLHTENRGAVIQFTDEGAIDSDDDTKGNATHTENAGSSPSSFGRFPAPQNIVRMPPINWAKYSVVGEPLDRMHQEQLGRPSPGEPGRGPAPEHVLAAPYRPLVDRLETPTRPGRANKTKK